MSDKGVAPMKKLAGLIVGAVVVAVQRYAYVRGYEDGARFTQEMYDSVDRRARRTRR